MEHPAAVQPVRRRRRSGHSMLAPMFWSMAINMAVLAAFASGLASTNPNGHKGPSETRVHVVTVRQAVVHPLRQVALAKVESAQMTPVPSPSPAARQNPAARPVPRLVSLPINLPSAVTAQPGSRNSSVATAADAGPVETYLTSQSGYSEAPATGGGTSGSESPQPGSGEHSRPRDVSAGVPIAAPSPAIAAPDPPAPPTRHGESRRGHVVGKLDAPYPESARRDGVEGTVVLEISIDGNGGFQSVHVAKSSGDRRLDDAACKQAPRWRFEPSVENGVGVPAILKVRVNFSLTDDE